MNKHLFQSTRLLFGFTLLLLILLTLSFSFSSLLGAKEPDYFPLAVGNTWNYIRLDFKGDDRTKVITETREISGKTYYAFRLKLIKAPEEVHETLLRKDENNQVIRLGEGEEEILFKLSAKEGEAWNNKGEHRKTPFDFRREDEYLVTLESGDEVVETPAGKFTNCLKFFYFAGPDSGHRFWLAPEVGIVQEIGGHGVHFILASAMIGNKNYPSGTSVTSKGKLITTLGEMKCGHQ